MEIAVLFSQRLKAKNQSILVGSNTILGKCYSYELSRGVILK